MFSFLSQGNMKGSASMTTMDVRMEALVRGNDGAMLGRVWAMLLVKATRNAWPTVLPACSTSTARRLSQRHEKP